MKTRSLFVAGVVILSSVLLSACTFLGLSDTAVQTTPITQLPQVTAAPTTAPTTTPALTGETPFTENITAEKIVLLAQIDNQSALGLLKSKTTVKTKSFGAAGEFVESINGLAGDKGHYWGFYVNGEYAQKGAGDTQLKTGDTIMFKYEVVDSSPAMSASPVASPKAKTN